MSCYDLVMQWSIPNHTDEVVEVEAHMEADR